uniref:DNA-directed RNA polymerase subunit N n=1 Tax=viral metagenome TaxID=1070528 RepID=A0A6C0C753_9ZZZZ
MLIPVRCFTCGKTVSDKWIPFIRKVNDEKNKETTNIKDLDIDYINLETTDKSIEGKVMDELGLHRYCCRRMILGNVHLITNI